MKSEATPVHHTAEIFHPTIKELFVFRSSEQASVKGAQRLTEHVLQNPDSHIGFATGNSMVRMLEVAADMKHEKGVDFSRTTASHLDERYPIDFTHESSFARYVHERAVVALGIQPRNTLYWDGMAKDPQAEAARVERFIRTHPVDLQFLGIGPPGMSDPSKNIHIAFVQQGTPFEAGCHLVQTLGAETLEREKRRGEIVPQGALTQGIATIMRARSHVLLAFGEEKGISLYHALYGPVTVDSPASALQLFGKTVSIYIDTACYQSMQKEAHKNNPLQTLHT